MPKRVEENQFYERYRKIRRDWGEVDPSTKIFEDKKRKAERKRKYKPRYDEDYDEYAEDERYR
ncbi:hypothetical protein IJD44_01015 [bacterium]|nr:hypothetical protein [bacterium]